MTAPMIPVPRAELEALRDALMDWYCPGDEAIDGGKAAKAIAALESRLAETGEDSEQTGFYRYIYIDEPWSMNYVVYRCFDDPEKTQIARARTNFEASFVCEEHAAEYCRFRNIPAPRVSPCPDGYVCVSTELVKFLNGEQDLEGVWFGERHMEKRGLFWWREYLRAAPQPSEGEV